MAKQVMAVHMSSVHKYQKYVGLSSDYQQSLAGSTLHGYVNKTKYTGGIDPLVIDPVDMSEDWGNCNVPLTWYEAGQYLLHCAHPITKEEFRNFKSLNTCDNQVASGWVQKPRFAVINGNYIFSGQVLHSYSIRQKPLTPWFVTDADGDVLTAHCNCVAGLGDSCIHVASLIRWVVLTFMFWEKLSCTSTERSWGVPPACIKKVTPGSGRLACISFATPAAKLSNILQEQSIVGNVENRDPPFKKYKMSDVEKVEYYTKLNALHLPLKRKPSVLKIIAPFQNQFQNSIPMIAKLSTLYDRKYEAFSLAELINTGKSIDFSLSESAMTMISNITLRQSKTKHWFDFRAGRPSASVAKEAVSCKSHFSNASLIKKITYPNDGKMNKNKVNDPDKDPRLYGIHSEPFAKESFLAVASKNHEEMSIRDAGLHIDPVTFILAASPDGFVMCSCHGQSCLEIKCPFVSRNETIEMYAKSKLSCLEEKVGGNWALNKKHQYFYQIQMQMAITDCNQTFFVIWTRNGSPHIELISKDPEFWNEIQPKLMDFFYHSIIPELLGKYVTRNQKKAKENLKINENIATAARQFGSTQTVIIRILSNAPNTPVPKVKHASSTISVSKFSMASETTIYQNENSPSLKVSPVPKPKAVLDTTQQNLNQNVLQTIPASSYNNDNKIYSKKPAILRRRINL